MNQYFDERSCTLSDYSIKLKAIPHQIGIKEKLKAFFSEAFKNPHIIQQTTLLPKYDEV